MERIQSVNPIRVQWCCDDRGITPDELADFMGIPKNTMERLMAGGDALTFSQLRKIAKFFNRGILFFLEAEPVNEERIHTPQFRTLTNQKTDLDVKVKALIERVERHREIYLSLKEDLGDIEEQEFSAPELPADNPKQAAEITREWLSLGDRNNFDSYRQAVEDRGILVFRTNGFNGDWQIPKEDPIIGFSLFDPACPAIVVKKQAFESRQSFTLMHELAHVLLHKQSFIDQEADLDSQRENERKANAFAGYLLVPDTLLATIADDRKPSTAEQYDDWLKPYRRAWGVSTEVILRRLLQNQRISEREYNAYRSWASQIPIPEQGGGSRKNRHLEPQKIFGDPFVRTVLDALSARYISLAKASTYLDNLKIKDVHQLEQHIAGL